MAECVYVKLLQSGKHLSHSLSGTSDIRSTKSLASQGSHIVVDLFAIGKYHGIQEVSYLNNAY